MRAFPATSALFLCGTLLGCGRAAPDSAAEAEPKGAPIRDSVSDAAAGPAPGGGAAETACKTVPFPTSIALPEASGAAWIADLDGAGPAVVVVSDSGNEGQYVVLDAKTGAQREAGQLPLDDIASDDLEGASYLSGELVVLTSSGYLRHYRRQNGAFVLSVEAYSITPKRPKSQRGCGPRHFNCGANYEALCLAPRPPTGSRCAGFAGSKADGTLLCLRRGPSGHFEADGSVRFAIAGANALAGCHFTGDDELLAGSNLYGLSRVYRVSHSSDSTQRTVAVLGSLGAGFPEALAASPEGEIYRLSDTGAAPSLVDAHRCE